MTISSSRRSPFNDMVVNKFVLKNNQIKLYPCFTFVIERRMGQPKTGFSFNLPNLTYPY